MLLNGLEFAALARHFGDADEVSSIGLGHYQGYLRAIVVFHDGHQEDVLVGPTGAMVDFENREVFSC